mgnify:CR=1 FL=1
MKKIIIILFVLNSIFLFAQEENKFDKKIVHEFGVNGTELLAQLLKISSDSNFNSKQTYLLTYKFLYKDYALRIGGGVDYNNNQTKIDEFTDVKSKINLKYDVRIGLEKQLPLYKKWRGYFGVDAIFGYNALKDITDSGFDKITHLVDQTYYGFGPVLGLQFNLTKRFCFATETSLVYKVYQGQDKTFFEKAPQFNNSKSQITGSSIKYNFPTSLYIIYRI